MNIQRIERKCGLIPSGSSETEEYASPIYSEEGLGSIMEEKSEFEESDDETFKEMSQAFIAVNLSDEINLGNDNFNGKVRKTVKILVAKLRTFFVI